MDARGYYVFVAGGGLRVGGEAALLFYRKEKTAAINWDARDLETRFPPEAVFRGGNWVRRGDLRVR